MIDEVAAKKMFESYAKDGKIDAENGGMEAFFQALGVSIEDPVTVAVNMSMEAKTCEWDFGMFKKGCAEYACTDVAGWKKAVKTMN